MESVGGTVTGHLRIADVNGVEVANTPITLQPFEERLVALGAFLPAGFVLSDGSLTLTIDGGDGRASRLDRKAISKPAPFWLPLASTTVAFCVPVTSPASEPLKFVVLA